MSNLTTHRVQPGYAGQEMQQTNEKYGMKTQQTARESLPVEQSRPQ
jgi:hypothetical protein